jgi:hypothetical protein
MISSIYFFILNRCRGGTSTQDSPRDETGNSAPWCIILLEYSYTKAISSTFLVFKMQMVVPEMPWNSEYYISERLDLSGFKLLQAGDSDFPVGGYWSLFPLLSCIWNSLSSLRLCVTERRAYVSSTGDPASIPLVHIITISKKLSKKHYCIVMVSKSNE